MKVRIPKHREFVIAIDENETRQEECWDKLQQIVTDYEKEGKSVYTPTFIEDNEEKVKELQKEYKFTYTIELK
ncbi:MAG: methylenetetrahydrofolate dehydrogenase [Ruminococcaceae bacterium]|jgi:hypothetical protein|nr:methylenetetrahydrofolate dehydrogenase [Oscillospiraceae bacterium]MBQ9970203.1 methylenetetrahydrofolate dehydrogenase [Oscillospiraceae bacterium]